MTLKFWDSIDIQNLQEYNTDFRTVETTRTKTVMKTTKVTGFTLFSTSLDLIDFKNIQAKRKRQKIIIPDRRFGDLLSYFLISLLILGFLSIFMEFPALHFGNTYVRENKKWVRKEKPFFHKPFQFNGKCVYDESIEQTLSSH